MRTRVEMVSTFTFFAPVLFRSLLFSRPIPEQFILVCLLGGDDRGKGKQKKPCVVIFNSR